MKNQLLCILGLSLLLISCHEKVQEESSLDGVWASVGYGRVVHIENGAYTLSDITEISCIPLMEGEISDFGDALQLKNDTLSLKDGINFYFFTRVQETPAVCNTESAEYKTAQARINDPEFNFEVMWKTFDDHYAYFQLRKIDWDHMYKKYRPMITSRTSEVELYRIMDEMLEAFNDGHIGLSAPDEIEEAAYAMLPKEENTAKEPKEELRNYKVARVVAQQYIPNGKSLKNGQLRWGTIEGNIGYLQVNQMMGMADYEISDTLSYRDYWMAYFERLEESSDTTRDELAGMNNALDQIMMDLETTDALIIDVRFNGGGKDEVGMALLNRLNPEEKVVFTKKGRLGNGFTPVIEVVQTASKDPYSKPVYLLISSESASATEIMTLSSLSLDHITRIGSNTEGVFSDILDKTLPNGWEIDLSSEVYESMEGTNYEGIGIPPDVEIGYPRDTQEFLSKVLEDLNHTGDAAIERALELLK
ncbi:MAG: S41 family peptidase [Bacteroidota bacterium]